ncbi:MAG: polysaccharide deacetylase family protein [Prevotella sp.]|nr:polysaccharide deacetylase family protein [Prevotella sp.]MCM1074970.1 polysaccharide deacetylase family protein [Ruminococcus sp.]
MLIERPPRLFRALVPDGLFRMNSGDGGRSVYLTFDDGPIPQATPLVLDILDSFNVKATFFMVGDNARRYPHLVNEVAERGHSIGNHTMHHLQGAKVTTRTYLNDIAEAEKFLITSGNAAPLFRPPHGWLRPRQARTLAKRYRIVMYDLVTRDYSRRVDADGILANVMKYTRPGSIIVFHDSLKSIDKLRTALPSSLEWLLAQGYKMELL